MKDTANFFVSARKHRPTTFEDVTGQPHVTRTLENALARKRLPQALLFCGPHGVGKTTCARILACKINRFETWDPTRPLSDLHTFELDAASYNSVDNVRNLVEQVRFPPPEGKFKVYIIDEVHMLSTQAFNAFLKTLEEPPPYAVFILATTEKQKVLPTITSRCQVFDFKRIDQADIVSTMREIAKKGKITVSEEALYTIARRADGSMRDALSMYDMLCAFSPEGTLGQREVAQVLHLLEEEVYFTMSEYLLLGKLAEALVFLDDIARRGISLISFVMDMQVHLRDLLLAKQATSFSVLAMSQERKKKYTEEAKRYDSPFLVRALDVFAQCAQGYKDSKNTRLWVELALIRIIGASATQAEKGPATTPKEALPTHALPATKVPAPEPPQQRQTTQKADEPEVVPRRSALPLHALLGKYKETITEESAGAGHRQLYYALGDASWTARGDWIHAVVENELYANALEKNLSKLEAYLGEHLQKKLSIRIETRKRRAAEEKAPASPPAEEKKHEQFFKEYPAAKVLKDRLGLDVEE